MVVASECAVVLGRARSSVHAGVSALATSVMVNVCLFAGSQQSQDQTSRRSGNTGEKHNENGVRLHERISGMSSMKQQQELRTLWETPLCLRAGASADTQNPSVMSCPVSTM